MEPHVSFGTTIGIQRHGHGVIRRLSYHSLHLGSDRILQFFITDNSLRLWDYIRTCIGTRTSWAFVFLSFTHRSLSCPTVSIKPNQLARYLLRIERIFCDIRKSSDTLHVFDVHVFGFSLPLYASEAA